MLKVVKLVAFILMAFLVIVSIFPFLPPFKNLYRTRVVLTSSMEPSVPRGSLIFNKWTNDSDLNVNDIITYRRPDKKDFFITHRIIKINREGSLLIFQVKGDHVPAPDEWKVHQGLIEGKVVFIIPFVGYFFSFSKTIFGFLLLIVLPCLILIISQIKNLLKNLKAKNLILLNFVVFFYFSQSFATFAFFSSTAVAQSGVNLSTISWDLNAPSSQIDSPINNQKINSQSFSINGLASDIESGVKKMEIGITPNGGSTSWILASGTNSWFYNWTIPQQGTYQIQSRATDNGQPVNNVETPNPGVTIIADWTEPTSEAQTLSSYQKTQTFNISYNASDNLTNVGEVKLYYSFNNGSWTYFNSLTPNTNPASGSFSFNSPGGDGFYKFLTIVKDDAGNWEDSDDVNFLSADTSTLVDTQKPITNVAVNSILAVVNDLIYNGGFETGSLDGWLTASTGDHQATDSAVKTGSWSALIGGNQNDSLSQNVTLSAVMPSTLSFWYKLVTDNNSSSGFFDTSIIHGSQETKVVHDGWDDSTIISTDLGWKNVAYQLNNLLGEDITLSFKTTQTDSNYNTWAFLDEIKLYGATNSAQTTTTLELSSHDSSGSGVNNIKYKIDNGPLITYSGGFSLSEGEHALSYFSQDEAGNSEETKLLNLKIQTAAIDFGVVLNEFLPNPAGSNDNSPMPGGEWVKLYNNSSQPADVAGWKIKDKSGGSLTISQSNSDNNNNLSDSGETVISASGILTVYRNGDSDFSINDQTETISLYNGVTLIDSFSYNLSSAISEGKSFKRDPDGTGSWKDPVVELIPIASPFPTAESESSPISSSSAIPQTPLSTVSSSPVSSASATPEMLTTVPTPTPVPTPSPILSPVPEETILPSPSPIEPPAISTPLPIPTETESVGETK